jgi:drug/metabolite transporter (DMT)-like permease
MRAVTPAERNGLLAAILSSTCGGLTGAVTRYVIGATDPVTLAAFRFGIAFLLILPLALWMRSQWPKGRDLAGVAVLGILYFALFFVLYNWSMAMTTAARGSLALSMLPLVTMLVAALLGREQITARKTLGVLIAVGGAAAALFTGLADAPPGAWRGDLLMLGATLIMAFYTVWSRPFMQRSSRLGFLAAGMGFGSAASALIAWERGGWALTQSFGAAQWAAVAFIGIAGGALAFYLWVYALERTTPTLVANTMTVNPIAASLLAAVLVGEPLGLNLAAGIAAVAIGIWLASTQARQPT